jgi:hypothetical protein
VSTPEPLRPQLQSLCSSCGVCPLFVAAGGRLGYDASGTCCTVHMCGGAFPACCTAVACVSEPFLLVACVALCTGQHHGVSLLTTHCAQGSWGLNALGLVSLPHII